MSSSTHSFARLTIDCLECCRALGRGHVLTQPQAPVICLLTHGSAGSTEQAKAPILPSLAWYAVRQQCVCVRVRVEENDCANRVQQPKAMEYQKKQSNDIARSTLAALAVRVRHGSPQRTVPVDLHQYHLMIIATAPYQHPQHFHIASSHTQTRLEHLHAL